ncbi:MAG: carboxypeptidase-like regulatory domain-containing protein [Anaerolineales bacterium]|nr:carboxypeptidase-like regulatory domain-containing protein [Anaerolineales bacterium]MDW8447324.1 carboxypeptidase-like regulatory domain-containing protein [Anaerolineales bacterium]
MTKPKPFLIRIGLIVALLVGGLSAGSWGRAASLQALPVAAQDTSRLYLPLLMKNFQPAWVVGRVYVQGSGAPLEGAQVCSQNGECDLSDARGNYRIHLAAGWKQLTAQKEGYVAATYSLNVPALQTREVDFALVPSQQFISAGFAGKVTDARTGTALSGAQVCNQLNQCAQTGSDGRYSLSVNVLGEFELRATKEGYLPQTKLARAANGETVTVDFALSKQWSGAWIKGKVIDASRGLNQNRALPGVRLCTQFGECAVSDSEGRYRISLTSADWREVTAQKEGFYAAAKGIQPQEGQEVELNFVLSPHLSGVVARIVLTWDATPKFIVDGTEIRNDLDAYLYIEHEIGNRVIYFDSKTEYLSSRLLYDVRDGSGPETIDITRIETSGRPTRYLYGVHNALSNPIKNLYELGAQVCLYSAIGDVARCYTAPPGNREFWFVFEMDQEGNIYVRDCLVDESPQVDWERPDGTSDNPNDKGNRVVGVSFPACPTP